MVCDYLHTKIDDFLANKAFSLLLLRHFL